MTSSYINYFHGEKNKTMEVNENHTKFMQRSVLTVQSKYLKSIQLYHKLLKKEHKTASFERKREDILKLIQILQDVLKI